MPEPGIGDSNFDHPTSDRKKPRRRPPARMKLPGEYAEFRLNDGRYLGEVMGGDFFGPESGVNGGRPISDSERQGIRDGNYALAGMFRDDSQFRPQSEAEAGCLTATGLHCHQCSPHFTIVTRWHRPADSIPGNHWRNPPTN